MTAEQFLAIESDGKRYELIDGHFITHTTPPIRHQSVLRDVLCALYDYCRKTQTARAFPGPLDVRLSDDSVVEPDILVVSIDRTSWIGNDHITGAPNIIIEVVSEDTRERDEHDKRKLYERYGVDEYWIVDPAIDTVKIYRRDGATFTRVAEITAETGGAITSPLLPGFSLDVDVVFGP
jgi:Uma2 family endonuclease